MLQKTLLALTAAALMFTGTVIADDAKADLEGVKCVVRDNPAKAEKSASYKDGKVFFCCGGCEGKFTENKEKYATNANRQLVATDQYEQKGCPVSGRDVDPDTAMKVAGVKVAFCCTGCKAKVEDAEDEKKIALVFGDKAFKNGFKKADAKKE